jgi:16S rRNA (cytosine1402-N4)-methyltransferase
VTEPPEDPKAVHHRRPRYRGTHPRHFDEKYKELAPDRYPELVSHLRARGQTPAGQHVPVLVEEVLAALAPQSGERGVDATLGWGGHAQRFLEKLSPGGQLLALDTDPIELPKTEARLLRLGFGDAALLVRRTNFAGVRAAIDAVGWHDGVDFLFADLGVSSMQIDDPSRGFSFKVDGPLDMRMNPRRGLSAAQWLERASADKLTAILGDHSDEPLARDIATALVARRGALTTTGALAAAVRGALEGHVPAGSADLAVRRVFQALRIEVNDELGALGALLRQLPGCLRPGGRAAIVTFHSGEDRRVKKAFADGERAGLYTRLSPEVIRPSRAEQWANPRAKPAKLRSARRMARAQAPSPTP